MGDRDLVRPPANPPEPPALRLRETADRLTALVARVTYDHRHGRPVDPADTEDLHGALDEIDDQLAELGIARDDGEEGS